MMQVTYESKLASSETKIAQGPNQSVAWQYVAGLNKEHKCQNSASLPPICIYIYIYRHVHVYLMYVSIFVCLVYIYITCVYMYIHYHIVMLEKLWVTPCLTIQAKSQGSGSVTVWCMDTCVLQLVNSFRETASKTAHSEPHCS